MKNKFIKVLLCIVGFNLFLFLFCAFMDKTEDKIMVYGYIDTNGKVRILIKYNYASGFSEGVAAVGIDGKAGYIDKTGEFVIKPAYDFAASFKRGKASVAVKAIMDKKQGSLNGKKWAVIDKSGVIINKLDFYSDMKISEDLYVLSEGRKYKIMNSRGRVVVNPYPDELYGISNGYFLFKWKDWGGVMDGNGNITVKSKYYDLHEVAPGLLSFQENKKTGIMDVNGRILLKPKYEFIESFSEGYSAVQLNGKLGFIDSKFNVVIKPKFQAQTSVKFRNGFAVVRLNDKEGVIDVKGDFVVEPQYQHIGLFSEGIAAVKLNDKFGYIDVNGEIVIVPQYDEAYGFENGMAAVMIKDKWGCINNRGELIVKAAYGDIYLFKDGYIVVCQGKSPRLHRSLFEIHGPHTEMKSMIMNKSGKPLDGKWLKDLYYDGSSTYESGNLFNKDGLVWFLGRKGWGAIDKTGKHVIKPEFDYFSDEGFSEGLMVVGKYIKRKESKE